MPPLPWTACTNDNALLHAAGGSLEGKNIDFILMKMKDLHDKKENPSPTASSPQTLHRSGSATRSSAKHHSDLLKVTTIASREKFGTACSV